MLPDARAVDFGHFTGMGTLVTMLDRVLWLANVRGLSAYKVGELSRHKDCVRNLKRGHRWTDDIVTDVAAVLECAPSWLRGEGPEPHVPQPDVREKLAKKARLERQARDIAQELRSVQDEIDDLTQEDKPPKRRRRSKMR